MTPNTKYLMALGLLSFGIKTTPLYAKDKTHIELSRSAAIDEKLHRNIGKSIADQLLSHLKQINDAALRGEETPKLSMNLLKMIAIETQHDLEKGSGGQLSLEFILDGETLEIRTLSLAKELKLEPLSIVLDPYQVETAIEKNPQSGATELVLKIPNNGESSSIFIGMELFGRTGNGPLKIEQIEYIKLSRLSINNPKENTSRSLIFEKKGPEGEAKLSILEERKP